MPELEHEVPSEDELRAYLQEHFAHSMLVGFRMSPEQLASLFCEDVARSFEGLIRMDGLQFAQVAFDAVLNGLRRMNALPRDHPFWGNTNCRPTIYKLGGFCRLELEADSFNVDALWSTAILPVWFGSNDFGQESWLGLRHQIAFDLRWPIYAALTIHLTANSTEDQAVQFLRRADPERRSLPILRRIATEAAGMAGAWATQVLLLFDAASSEEP